MKYFSLPLLVTILWLILALSFFFILQWLWLSLEDFTFRIYNYIREHVFLWVFLFIFIYTIRPLVFIPATPFNLFAGVVFWFFWGTIICSLANFTSVIFSYYVGYFTGGKVFESQSGFHRIKKLQNRLKKDTFFSVSLTRILFFPFDLTNYLCWVFKIPILPYILATFTCIPGTAIFVLAGAAFYGEEITSFWELSENLNSSYLYWALLFFLLSLVVWKYFQKKYKISAS